MKHSIARTMICTQQEGGESGQHPTACAVIFEAPTLLALSTSAVDWMNTHPVYRLLAFSHALETRLEPGASLTGPQPYAVYTGVLLVSPPPRGQE